MQHWREHVNWQQESKEVIQSIREKLPEKLKGNISLRLFGLFKVPMLGFLKPIVEEMTEEKCVVKIPLRRQSRNHLNSMYFGALAAGADCAGGLTAMRYIEESGKKVDLVFKDFQAKFLKRAEGDTYFTNIQGKKIRELVEKCIQTGEREEMPMEIVATTPDKLGQEPVATFILTLSLKCRD